MLNSSFGSKLNFKKEFKTEKDVIDLVAMLDSYEEINIINAYEIFLELERKFNTGTVLEETSQYVQLFLQYFVNEKMYEHYDNAIVGYLHDKTKFFVVESNINDLDPVKKETALNFLSKVNTTFIPKKITLLNISSILQKTLNSFDFFNLALY